MAEIEVRGLTKTFSKVTAVRNMSFTDPAGIAWLRGLLRALAGEGRTIVVASHVLSEVAQTVDHVVIVNAGELRFSGPLHELGGSGRALESAFLKLTAVPG